jgi:GT2 family glycosyltransferase
MVRKSTNPLVSIAIVTHNSRRFIRTCLQTVFEQDYSPLEVIIVDNCSTDGCGEMLLEFEDRVRVIYNDLNAGFAAGQNQAIGASRGDWILTLNPDVRLDPGFVGRLVSAGRRREMVGVLCGKLLRADSDLNIPAEPKIDSAGMYFTPNLRHFDRGWNEPDDGRFDQPEYVFGATAAAALYRRGMIADVALDDGFFDPDFFAYREDADVAWRAQLLGWRCLYVPDAVAWHVRRVLPRDRWKTPSVLRMHSVKNRFLMRMKNMSRDLYCRHWLEVTIRDLAVVAGCLLAEPESLPAFWNLARCLRRSLAKRRQIMSRRRASDDYIAAWFSRYPVTRPLEFFEPRASAAESR